MSKETTRNILITGANSYIGTSFRRWVMQYNASPQPAKYSVDTVDMKDVAWKEKDFSVYDVIFHVAAIAHIKETKKNAPLYFKINRDLAVETAQKAKAEGVKHFIFLSSMSVYGIESGVISKNTPTNPQSSYGISKLQAEEKIKSLEDDEFKIAIIRPPLVYGKNCKGNYPRLAKLALKLPIFPAVDNQRSMIYIDNLTEFVRLVIENYNSGVFFPQNQEYVCTSEMVKLIAGIHGKRVRLTKIFNPLLNLLRRVSSEINKVFGNLVYDMNLSEYRGSCIVCFSKSIEITESIGLISGENKMVFNENVSNSNIVRK